ncbi:MAG: hypothetical protein ABL927_06400, partial [Bdellovibrionales bacterium]
VLSTFGLETFAKVIDQNNNKVLKEITPLDLQELIIHAQGDEALFLQLLNEQIRTLDNSKHENIKEASNESTGDRDGHGTGGGRDKITGS